MSASHPLAADDSHASAERERPGKPEPATSRDASADASKTNAVSRSLLPEQVVVAPERLGLESRIEFRQSASDLIDLTTAGTGRLVVDCGHLRSIDSAGLNALIIIQRNAAKRRVGVFLRGLDDELRSLLVLTKLDDLFELQDGQSH